MDQDAIAEMFSAYGSIQLKRMFSGFGLYSEGVCFCLVLRGGEFYFKVDETSAPRFTAEGCKPFSYSQRKSGKVVTVNSFWQMPERLYDDPDELADWTRQAVAAALRLQLAKPKRKRKNASQLTSESEPSRKAVRKGASGKAVAKKTDRRLKAKASSKSAGSTT